MTNSEIALNCHHSSMQ